MVRGHYGTLSQALHDHGGAAHALSPLAVTSFGSVVTVHGHRGHLRVATNFQFDREEEKLPDVNPEAELGLEEELAIESMWKGDGRLGLLGMDDPLDPGPPESVAAQALKDLIPPQKAKNNHDIPNRDVEPERVPLERPGDAETVDEPVVGMESAEGGSIPKKPKGALTSLLEKMPQTGKSVQNNVKDIFMKTSVWEGRPKTMLVHTTRKQRAKAIWAALEPSPSPAQLAASDPVARVKASLAAAAEAASVAEKRRIRAAAKAIRPPPWPRGAGMDSVAKRQVHGFWQAAIHHATGRRPKGLPQHPDPQMLPSQIHANPAGPHKPSKDDMIVKAAAALQAGRQSVKIGSFLELQPRNQQRSATAFQAEATSFAEGKKGDAEAEQGKDTQESPSEEQEKDMEEAAKAQEDAEKMGSKVEASEEKAEAVKSLEEVKEGKKAKEEPYTPKKSSIEQRWQKYKDELEPWLDAEKIKTRNCLPPIKKPHKGLRDAEIDLESKLPICTRQTKDCNLFVKDGQLIEKGSELDTDNKANAQAPAPGQEEGGPTNGLEAEGEEEAIGEPLLYWAALLPNQRLRSETSRGSTQAGVRDLARLSHFL